MRGGERHPRSDDAEERSGLSRPKYGKGEQQSWQRRARADRQVRLPSVATASGLENAQKIRDRADRARAQRRGAARLRPTCSTSPRTRSTTRPMPTGSGEAARPAHLRYRARRDPDAAVLLHRPGGALHPHLPQGPDGETPAARIPDGMDPLHAGCFKGERLVFWNGCRNCQWWKTAAGRIRDLYNERTSPFGAAVLTGEGAKVQPACCSRLKSPATLRPWLSVRMPDLPLQRRGRDRPGALLRRLLQQELPLPDRGGAAAHRGASQRGRPALQGLAVHHCHVVGELARPDPGSAAPNLLLAKERLRPDWIVSHG